jgi:hypothetical protein
MKKVSNYIETCKEREAREYRENKIELLDFIRENPGATIGDLVDISTFVDERDFLQMMVILFDEASIVSDSGHYFTDEITRQKMSAAGLY